MLSALLVLALSPLAAQAPEAPSKPAEVRVLERIAVVGASVSAGYHAEARLAEMLAASLRQAPSKSPADVATEMLFLTMGKGAQSQLQRISKSKPTLIVGIDFAFWFGYGSSDFDSQPLASEEARLELFDKGIALLDGVETTLVISDFPDMSPAVGRMLLPAQLPKPETLEKLNQRLAEWAKPRANVIVIPMSTWMNELRAKKPITLGEKTFEPAVTATWMQSDGLHPTAAGLAALTALIQTELIARKLVDAQDVVTDPAEILERANAAKPVEAGASGGK